jgi:hypothetical protein
MARPVSVLVVAKATADSPQLIEALQARARQGPMEATLVLPCSGPGLASKEAGKERLNEALAAWREAGLESVSGVVGDQDPLVAVTEEWDPLRYDEVIVSTLPGHASEWLRWDLPHRIARHTDAHVTHVLSSTPQAPLQWEPRKRTERSPLGPLSVLAWGRPKDDSEKERERQRRLRALDR